MLAIRLCVVSGFAFALFFTFAHADITDDLLNALAPTSPRVPSAATTSAVVTPSATYLTNIPITNTPSTSGAATTTQAEQIATLQALVLALTKQLAQILTDRAASLAANAVSASSTSTASSIATSTAQVVPAIPESDGINITRDLVIGSRGEDVMRLQKYLIFQSLMPADGATGYYGRVTELAVKTWQTQNEIVSKGTPATTGYGMVGKRTRAAILAATSRTTASSTEIQTPRVTSPSVEGAPPASSVSTTTMVMQQPTTAPVSSTSTTTPTTIQSEIAPTPMALPAPELAAPIIIPVIAAPTPATTTTGVPPILPGSGPI